MDKTDPCVLAAAYLNGDNRRDQIDRIVCGFITKAQEKPCDVYLFQTAVPGVQKFGIAIDAVKRGKTSKQKARYQELLSSHRLPHRWQAICIEAALMESPSEPPTSGWQSVLDQLDFSTEFTTMGVGLFNEQLEAWIPEITQGDAMEFVIRHAPSALQRLQERVEKLRNGELIMALDNRWHDGPRITMLGSHCDGMDAWFTGEMYSPISIEDALTFHLKQAEASK